MAGAGGSRHLASTAGHLPYENVAFMDKDGARPGLTQEGRFLVGSWDHQCPMLRRAVAICLLPLCPGTIITAVLRLSGSHPQLT